MFCPQKDLILVIFTMTLEGQGSVSCINNTMSTETVKLIFVQMTLLTL